MLELLTTQGKGETNMVFRKESKNESNFNIYSAKMVRTYRIGQKDGLGEKD